jgi:hypothetical protein
MSEPVSSRDVALGLVVSGARAGSVAFQIALVPGRVALRLPGVGHLGHRIARDMAHQGALARDRAQARLEAEGDALLAGPLTEAVAHAIAQHRVIERLAREIVATADLEAIVDTVLEHERTQLLMERILESRLVDALTERVLASPELDQVVEYVATSPRVLDAVAHQTQSLAQEMASGVRRRTQAVDDIAERTVRGWLRRPRTQPS